MIRRLLHLLVLLPAALVLGAFAAVPMLAGGGCHPAGGRPALALEAGVTVVKIDGCTFVPTVNRVPVGTTVTFLNTGLAPHDVTGTRGEWRSEILEPGESWSSRFDAPGIYAYSCSLHPGMAGVIAVGDGVAAAAGTGDSDVADPIADVTTTADAGSEGGLELAGAAAAGLVAGALGTAVATRRRRTAD